LMLWNAISAKRRRDFVPTRRRVKGISLAGFAPL
jgi:hypothetical protein